MICIFCGNRNQSRKSLNYVCSYCSYSTVIMLDLKHCLLQLLQIFIYYQSNKSQIFCQILEIDNISNLSTFVIQQLKLYELNKTDLREYLHLPLFFSKFQKYVFNKNTSDFQDMFITCIVHISNIYVVLNFLISSQVMFILLVSVVSQQGCLRLEVVGVVLFDMFFISVQVLQSYYLKFSCTPIFVMQL
eukprot:TRINITY_DN8554_c0_g1_i1.p3 TRINITY_DN8554_c0_g1~~TRINITY_DN8554_c0_g1_i1.p3  ORF type:complete len:189 (-),score=-13.55 TRINITY_DN8554_c0_g1_i1:244-810(-)